MKDLRASRHRAPNLSQQMLIIYRPIDQLKPDPSNPRRQSKKQIRQIADSIKTFGFNVPQFKDLSLLGLDFSIEVYLRYYVASATMACYIIPFICRERGVPIGADSDPTNWLVHVVYQAIMGNRRGVPVRR
jgi:hypothetical protein